ncbi:MAG: nitroreductase family protein [candidate division KSB1 bacterium]|nr:nitroreductase family protein [candidate division KSB1 bacterium]
MHFENLIQTRYSVRAYSDKDVQEEKLQAVLRAALMAPTAVNQQPFRFIVLSTRGNENELRRVYKRDWLLQAPLVICACAAPDEAWSRMDGRNYADVDTVIAMDHLILAATEQGLGTCWIAAFDPEAVREVFLLQENWEPIALTPLGYAADAPKPKQRKSVQERVIFASQAKR